MPGEGQALALRLTGTAGRRGLQLCLWTKASRLGGLSYFRITILRVAENSPAVNV